VVYPIRLPALRDRLEDLPLLVAELLRRSRIARDRGIRAVDADALESLSAHRWPGNIREMDNVLQRAALACDGKEIGMHHLPHEIRSAPRRSPTLAPGPRHRAKGGATAGRTLREVEMSVVRQAVESCGGNITAAAKLLGVSRTKLYRDLKSPR